VNYLEQYKIQSRLYEIASEMGGYAGSIDRLHTYKHGGINETSSAVDTGRYAV
jgi:hypothetical protein